MACTQLNVRHNVQLFRKRIFVDINKYKRVRAGFASSSTLNLADRRADLFWRSLSHTYLSTHHAPTTIQRHPLLRRLCIRSLVALAARAARNTHPRRGRICSQGGPGILLHPRRALTGSAHDRGPCSSRFSPSRSCHEPRPLAVAVVAAQAARKWITMCLDRTGRLTDGRACLSILRRRCPA